MSAPATSVRFPADILDYVDRISAVLKQSGLNVPNSRNDVICMILEDHRQKSGSMFSNDLFKLIMKNTKSPSKVSAYTVRGIVAEITKHDVSEETFNAVAGVD